jgi:hypothetical protein
MEYDKSKYKAWQLPHPVLLHWILNPGLVINELLLGQRIPKLLLIDQASNAPFIERQRVPCPSCGDIHDGRLWSKSNSFGHWFGYVCPSCGKQIPCLWNVASLLVLALTFPIWMTIRHFGEAKWLAYERVRIERARQSGVATHEPPKWWRMGLIWGAVMFGLSVFKSAASHRLGMHELLVQAAVWTVGGLVFGGFMWLVLSRRRTH